MLPVPFLMGAQRLDTSQAEFCIDSGTRWARLHPSGEAQTAEALYSTEQVLAKTKAKCYRCSVLNMPIGQLGHVSPLLFYASVDRTSECLPVQDPAQSELRLGRAIWGLQDSLASSQGDHHRRSFPGTNKNDLLRTRIDIQTKWNLRIRLRPAKVGEKFNRRSLTN